MTFKPIPTQFTKKGFRHVQTVRVGDWAIYERSKGQSRHWEVVHIRRHNGYTIAGAHVEPAEYYPASEDWGTHGFTLTEEADAMDKLDQLTAKPNAA